MTSLQADEDADSVPPIDPGGDDSGDSDGWIWTHQERIGLSSDEFEAWEREGVYGVR